MFYDIAVVHMGLDCYKWLLPACVTGKQLVTFTEWDKIDLEEMKRGAEVGKPREKITQISEMLKVASSWKKTMTKWFSFQNFSISVYFICQRCWLI